MSHAKRIVLSQPDQVASNRFCSQKNGLAKKSRTFLQQSKRNKLKVDSTVKNIK